MSAQYTPGPLTLVQAQQRYIDRVNGCQTGHLSRVRRAAYRRLDAWAKAHGFDAKVVWRDAEDMALLERDSEE